jgi:predicted ATP-grasp superfamily ATP-dependent carboligase
VTAGCRVLVLDGFWNKSLAAVRALGRRGLFVGAGERTSLAPALFSRHCRRRFVHPSVAREPAAFLAALERELAEGRYDVLLPMELATQLFLAERRERLAGFVRLPIADAAATQRVDDKAFVTAFAAAHGIACPETRVPSGLDDLAAAARELRFPVLVKPRHSSGGRGIRRAERRADLEAAYAAVHARHPLPLVQECLPPGGDALGVAVLLDFAAEARVSFAYRRLHQYPVAGGPSTLRESVAEPALRRTAERLLSLLGWVGVAMVEFKVDPRDGRPKLLEVNPRFWGSLHHAVVCGVDFPYLLCRLAMDGVVPAVPEYTAGVRSRSLLHGELCHFLASHGRLRPGLGAFSIPDDVLSAEDPLPVLGRILSLAALLSDRELRALAGH